MRGDFEAYLTISLDEILAMEDEAGIDVVVIMPETEMAPKNKELGELLNGNPRTIGCALINPHKGANAVTELKSAITEWGLKGLKLMGAIHKYNVDDEMVLPLMQTARELGIIASIHSGPDNCHPTRIGNIASQFPEVPIIMDHMGFPDNVYDAIEVAEKNSNIYLGTTILRFYRRWADDPDKAVPIEVKEAIQRLGPERVVFGSNLPEYRPIQVMRAIQRLQLGEDAERLILGENLARIYQL
jgi:predicted TIM-barrel fold metal-dependent hydrolase